MRTMMHTDLLDAVTCLPTDYTPWGKVERWSDDAAQYADCSCGCKHACALQGELGQDWVVCTNIKSARFGKLTFEHQAGASCYEPDTEMQMLSKFKPLQNNAAPVDVIGKFYADAPKKIGN